jgi:hypothetical protein
MVRDPYEGAEDRPVGFRKSAFRVAQNIADRYS